MAKFDITKFAEALPDRADLPDSGMTREIPVGDILDNPRNFYPRPDNKALVALMESIQANGLLEPPTVVPAEDGKYRLISGHSRMAALRLLAANRDEAVAKQFSTVLCRVLPAMTEEQELCAVIEANRQRVKSNALLAQEAEKLKESYIRRKKAGEAFPVGLRDWIAKEMQINATKVGNLQVIKKGLKVPGGRRASCPRPPRLRSPAWTTRRSTGCWIGSLTTVAHGRSTTCASFRPAGPAASISARIPAASARTPRGCTLTVIATASGAVPAAAANVLTATPALPPAASWSPSGRRRSRSLPCPEIRQQTTHGSRI